MTKRPEGYVYSGHRSYLIDRRGKNHRKWADLGSVSQQEGVRNICPGRHDRRSQKYYAVEDQRFLGHEGFGEEISRDSGEKDQRKRNNS
ncbi:MAG: hypothetical protein WCH75_09120 [Candidatus Binatia bacterium]